MTEDQKEGTSAPRPEVLTVQTSSLDATVDTQVSAAPAVSTDPAPRRSMYRPSHKATFIGLTVVAVILILNAVVIAFLMKGQADAVSEAQQNVTVNLDALNKLGVDRNPSGGAETILTIGPNTKFNGKVAVAGDVSMSGQLNLNNTLTASAANLSKVQAGTVAASQLSVNGDGTMISLKLQKELAVAGTTRIQGQLTVDQLVTVNNNVNVVGSLAIGGALSVRNFQVNTLTVAGHLITTGAAPSVSAGAGAGSNGTVSISGNDTSGTIAINTGINAGGGTLVNLSFQTKYATTPHVVVSPVGRAVNGFYINRTSNGFSISTAEALPPGGFAFDYVVTQ